MSDPDALKNTNFRKTKPVVFIVHGWVGHARSEMNDLVKNCKYSRQFSYVNFV